MATAAQVKARAKPGPKKEAAPPPSAAKAAELDVDEETTTVDGTDEKATLGDVLFPSFGDSLADERTVINGLWYGGPGTGKTSAVATMANLGRIIVVNAEGGLKRRPLEALGVQTANIVTYPRKGERVTFKGLEDLYWSVSGTLASDPDAIVGIVWDSLTEIHKALLDGVVEEAVVKATKAHKDRDRFFTEMQDYGKMTEQMRVLLRRFRDLPCHFVMTALPRRDIDDDGKVTYRPSVTPALQADVLGFVDVVCHTVVKEIGSVDEYQGSFAPIGKFEGKDRFGALPPKLITPSFERVFGYIEDDLTLDNDPVMKAGKARRLEEAAAIATPEAEADSPVDPMKESG